MSCKVDFSFKKLIFVRRNRGILIQNRVAIISQVRCPTKTLVPRNLWRDVGSIQLPRFRIYEWFFLREFVYARPFRSIFLREKHVYKHEFIWEMYPKWLIRQIGPRWVTQVPPITQFLANVLNVAINRIWRSPNVTSLWRNCTAEQGDRMRLRKSRPKFGPTRFCQK
jgi:hypothetical protein